jgi:hypothetical protein
LTLTFDLDLDLALRRLRPPKFEQRNGADSSGLARVLGEAWVASRLLVVDAVAFIAGQFADGHLVCLGSSRLASATVERIAVGLGMIAAPLLPEYDLVIVGAGPAGLAAVVNAASEGLRTVIVEAVAPGARRAPPR